MVKINKTSFLIIAVIIYLVFVLLGNNSSATSSEAGQLAVSQTNPLEYLQKNLLSPAPVLPGTLPINFSSFGDFRLLNTEGLSSGNLVSALKAVAALAINLFLIVIQVVAGILKALLPFLAK